MKNIAIYPGAFNPIGNHHLDIAQQVLKHPLFDELWISPCNNHSFNKKLVSGKHRLEMCRLAVNNLKNDKIKVSSFEIDNNLPGETYTCIKELYKNNTSNDNYYIIIGMDNALNINKFYRWQDVIDMIPFIVIPRSGSNVEGNEWFFQFPHIYLDKVVTKDISSTMIRNWLKEPIKNMNQIINNLDSSVAHYIGENDFYAQPILEKNLKIYKCSKCQKVLKQSGDVEKEMKEKFLGHNLADCQILCIDCYNKSNPDTKIEKSTENAKIKIIQTETLLKTPFVEMLATEFVNKDKESKFWTWFRRPNDRSAVVIVPIHKPSNKLVITKEFRVPICGFEYGCPAGLIDENETVEDAARRELKEETGLTITKFIKTSPLIYNSAGITNESISIVYVECEGEVSDKETESTEDITTFLMGPEEVKELMEDNTKKIGAKAWMTFDRYVTYKEI